MRFAFRLLASLAAIASACPAIASTDCRYAPDIVASADFLLVDPKNAQRFWRDHASTDAAYLLIRYGGLSQAGAMRLVDGLRQRRVAPQRIQDLRLALAPPDARLALLDDRQEGASVPPGGPSFFRAMIVDGREDWLFADMARRAGQPGADRSAATQFQFRLAAALADLGDADRTRLAARAEAHGLWPLTLELLGAKSDPRDWLAVLKRSPLAPADQAQLNQAFARIWRGHATLRPRPFPVEKLPAELRAAVAALDANQLPQWRGIDSVMELVAAAPNTRTLMTVLNQTGEARLGSEVAAPLLADIRAGKIDAGREADLIDVRMVDGMVSVLGLQVARTQLQSFRVSTPPLSDTALGALERVMARHLLAPFARGDGQDDPARPDLLSFGFDWSGWLNTAGLIRTGGQVPGSYRAVAAELLHAAGRHQQAIDILTALGPTDEARRQAHTMLLALDRMCGGEIWPSPVMGDPIYRFDRR